MAQKELEQIAMAMMMMAEDPERRPKRQLQQPLSTSIDVLSPSTKTDSHILPTDFLETRIKEEDWSSEGVPEGLLIQSCGNNEEGDTEELDEVGNNNYSINPNSLSTPSPSSPAGSLKSSSSGGGGGANSATRRIFTPEFKQRVLEAFTNDPDCIGNQRATARKFGIHRRQVQKWLQHFVELKDRHNSKDQHSEEEEQNQKKTTKNDENTACSSPSRDLTTKANKSRRLTEKSKNTTNTNPTTNSSLLRTSNRLKSKSKMPIVAGKGPSIPQASAVSSSPSASLPSSSPLMNLGKSIGNIHQQLFGNHNSNLFMGLTSPLLSLPLALEGSSSRHSPPENNNMSPPLALNLNGGGNNNNNQNGHLSAHAQKMLELVDELCYLYPSEDFSLLRTAMLKNEVSFTKLSPPIRRNHKNSTSPPSSNDYITQQTLQMIKNQNEYLQLLQSGYANFSNFPDVANSSESNTGSKYPSWLNPFAGFQMPTGKNGGRGGEERGRRTSDSNSDYTFASPKAPVSVKSKTVAAVLAATRNGPVNNNKNNNNAYYSTPYDKPSTKRPTSSQRRKTTNGNRPMKSSSTITYQQSNDDDYIDPTSMLEVVTIKPPAGSGSGSSENQQFGGYASPDGQGMDLSTSSSSTAGVIVQRSQNSPHPQSSTSTIRSKAMNKDYGFLSELGLIRKDGGSQSHHNHNGNHDNSSTGSSTASLEHFVDNVLSHHHQQLRKSVSPPNSGSPLTDSSTNDSDRTKHLVLEAFNFDPELAGDARGVARKFGLNIRVVQKWIREAPTRSIPPVNGTHSSDQDDDYEDAQLNLRGGESLLKPAINSNGPSTTNKRKNPKPNQICDFTAETFEEENPLDMVVPIKKRRVSTPTPQIA